MQFNNIISTKRPDEPFEPVRSIQFVLADSHSTILIGTSFLVLKAATLICAMELLRRTDPRVKGMSPFTIGLWVGNDVTPGTRSEAKKALGKVNGIPLGNRFSFSVLAKIVLGLANR